jgi:predicted nuclease with TOPRIM domain
MMSYKAFAKIKERMEIEFIKTKSPEELNEIFVQLNDRYKQLQVANEKLKELVDIKNDELVDLVTDKAELVEALDMASFAVDPKSLTGIVISDALAKHKGEG